MKQEILIETLSPDDSCIIVESSADGKNTWLSGIFMQSEKKNRNGRNYPISEISRAVETAGSIITEQGGLFGELDHPDTLRINLERISHVISEMRLEGNNALGKAKLIDTPFGKIAQELVKSGVKIGASSRGAGAVNDDGYVSDYNFVTVDLVATPSAPNAYPNTVYESLIMNDKGKEVLTLAEHLREDKNAQKYFKRAIEKFLNQNLFAKR